VYQYRTGVEKDEQKPVEWYQKVAGQEYAQAQYNLGVCYQYGTVVEKDEQKAVKWYQKALNKNMIKHKIILVCVIMLEWN